MAKRKTPPTVAQVIRRRRTDILVAQSYWSLLLRLALVTAVLVVMVTQVFLLTQVSGNGMFPALEDGDLVLAYRLQKEYAKQDVIVFQAEGKTQIGRILAREGDVVSMDETGTLRVNGTVQSGEILYPTYPREGAQFPYVVPESSFYVLCDYRTQCRDSRDFGPVNAAAVEGKVITILRRRGI